MKTILEHKLQISESDTVAAATPEPPRNTPEALDPHLKLQRILVPVDFTPASLHALRYASRLAERFGGGVHLLHVLDRGSFINDVDSVVLAKSTDEISREASEQLGRLAQSELGTIPHTKSVILGKPAQEIIRVAGSLDIDLIILALHEYKGLDRLFQRHTARQVEHDAHCPVLTLHCDEAGEIEPTLWKDTDDGRSGSGISQSFMKALGTPNT